MDDVPARVSQRALEGQCCSEILVRMALEDQGSENEEFARAARALCLGVHTGDYCGALSGAALVVGLLADPQDVPALVEDLVDWFTHANSTTSCLTIVDGDQMNRFTKCPSLVAECYEYVLSLLEMDGGSRE